MRTGAEYIINRIDTDTIEIVKIERENIIQASGIKMEFAATGIPIDRRAYYILLTNDAGERKIAIKTAKNEVLEVDAKFSVIKPTKIVNVEEWKFQRVCTVEDFNS